MKARDGYVRTDDGVRLYFRAVGDGPQRVVLPNGIYMLEDFERLAEGRTLIGYDVRNRGASDPVTDEAKLERGIQNDVDDLETVRRHFEIERLDVIGHSYMGLTVILYASKHAAVAGRLVQLAPMEPNYGRKEYPAHLTGADSTLEEVSARLAELQRARGTIGPQEFCRQFWSILAVLYVVDPRDAGKIRWGRCELPNERSFLTFWNRYVLPSILRVHLTAEEIGAIQAPVLVVHGTRDRNVAYGGAREWALLLGNARLVTVLDAAHAPWIEAPELVFGAIDTFLRGNWPRSAETVDAIDPSAGS